MLFYLQYIYVQNTFGWIKDMPNSLVWCKKTKLARNVHNFFLKQHVLLVAYIPMQIYFDVQILITGFSRHSFWSKTRLLNEIKKKIFWIDEKKIFCQTIYLWKTQIMFGTCHYFITTIFKLTTKMFIIKTYIKREISM